MPITPSPRELSRAAGTPLGGAGLRAAKRLNRLAYRLPRPRLPDRLELASLLNHRGLVGCAVEVGVKRGEFSAALLERWAGRHLVSVDPWSHAPGDAYQDVANVRQDEHDAFHRETLDRLRPFGDRSTVWRSTGSEAATRIPHHSLDLVYLDARHDRASVAQDVAEWFPKVRPGGVIAGHDYLDGVLPEGDFGVRQAVDAFFGDRDLHVACTFADPPWPSWYVLVPVS